MTEQNRTKLRKFVERIKSEAFIAGYDEGYKEGMHVKQWDKDIEKSEERKIGGENKLWQQ